MPLKFRGPLVASLVACALTVSAIAQANSEYGQYLAGRHAEALNDTDRAAGFMLRVLEENPDDQKLLRRTFILALSAGQMETAISLAQRIERSGGKMSTAEMLLGVDLIRQKKFEEAKNLFDAMPRNGLTTYAAPLALAWSYVGLKDIDKALASLAPLDEKSGFAAMRDLHTGLIYDVAGRKAEAEKAYRGIADTLAQAPVRVVRAAGALFERSGRKAEARQLYVGYLMRDPESIVMQQELERLDAGGAAMPLVTTAAEGVAESLFNVASALPRDRASDIAVVYSRLALHLRPDFDLARLLIGELFDSDNLHEKANAVYETISRNSPYSWPARLRVAANLSDLGKVDDAIARLNEMAAERPERTDALIRMGGILRSKERYQEAVVAYDKAAMRLPAGDSKDWFFYYSRGIALERSDKWQRAEADFLKALEMEPEQPYVLNYLGYSWVEKGLNIDRARKMIERAVEQRRNDGFIVDSLGWVLYRLGDYEGSVKQLERAIRLRPSDPVINDHLGDAYWRVGRKLEARFQWQRALDLKPEQNDIVKIEGKLNDGLKDEKASGSGG
jgi:tetratricopeptide (TPR) repeat protein